MKKTTTSHLRKRLISGLLVIVPAGVTFFVLRLAYEFTVGLIVPVLRTLLGGMPYPVVAVLSCIMLIAALYGLGTLASFVVGRRLIHFAERFVGAIPVVKTIYAASKQVIEMFMQERPEGQRPVALVEFPGPGLKAIGFVTGRMRLPDGCDYYRIIIPTTPNPTTGFLQMVRVEDAVLLDISTEDAVTTLMSAGFLGPDELVQVSEKNSSSTTDEDPKQGISK